MTLLEEFRRAKSAAAANRLLLRWLSDDDKRAALFAEVRADGGVLKFQSRADKRERSWLDEDSEFSQNVYLLCSRRHVLAAMTDRKLFSNDPYRALGSGNFMLGLDDEDDHRDQRQFAAGYLNVGKETVRALAHVAFRAAAVLPVKQRALDLVELSEQAAARFIGFLFGFEQGDQALIEESMRKAYRGLNFFILGRHFVSEPGAVDEASRAMGALLIRAAHLIDLYRGPAGRDEEDERKKLDDELKELQDFEDGRQEQPLAGFEPVLLRMAKDAEGSSKYSGAELAMIVVGMIAGTIGNIQASVSIAINEFFRDADLWERVRDTAKRSIVNSGDYCDPAEPHTQQLEQWIWEALRLNPPAAFLPRRMVQNKTLGGVDIKVGETVILAVGGATREKGTETFKSDATRRDQLVFGAPSGDDDPLGRDHYHHCIGTHLAMPAVLHFVRQVAALPGLAQTLDPRTGQIQRLEKRWGFNCRRYPLEYLRTNFLVQSPLIVMMRVKTPVPEHAEALKRIITYGAPRIEKKLLDSKHVHFASFVFIENDSRLVLYTVYDGDFDAYIEHFALDIGPVFDRIFAHVQDAPPLPVNEFPKEFVDTIRRYNVSPAGGYFFSAYRKITVAKIRQTFKGLT
jgi:cytochrome P450